MPRNYIRKTKPKYKIEDLRRAIEDIKSKKLTLGKAATTYSIPKTTLFRQLKQHEFKIPKKGRSVFNKEQEVQLEKYILDCCKTCHGITPSSLRRIAYRFAEANKLKHNFNKETQLAGKDWYYGFISRHPTSQSQTLAQDATSIPDNANDMSNTIITPPHTSVPLAEIVCVPLIPKTRTSSALQNKRHSQIFSSTPIKIQLEEKQKRQIERKAKKEYVPKKERKKNIKTIQKKPRVKDKRVSNSKNALQGNENEEELYCIICNEKYESPPTEDWIMCAICKLWSHEKCTAGQTSRSYVCDSCQLKNF